MYEEVIPEPRLSRTYVAQLDASQYTSCAHGKARISEQILKTSTNPPHHSNRISPIRQIVPSRAEIRHRTRFFRVR